MGTLTVEDWWRISASSWPRDGRAPGIRCAGCTSPREVDPTPWLSGGELLLTSGTQLLGDERPRALHRPPRRPRPGRARLRTRRVDARAPRAALIERADRAGFPLFEVPFSMPFITITETAMARLVNERYDILRRGVARPAGAREPGPRGSRAGRDRGDDRRRGRRRRRDPRRRRRAARLPRPGRRAARTRPALAAIGAQVVAREADPRPFIATDPVTPLGRLHPSGDAALGTPPACLDHRPHRGRPARRADAPRDRAGGLDRRPRARPRRARLGDRAAADPPGPARRPDRRRPAASALRPAAVRDRRRRQRADLLEAGGGASAERALQSALAAERLPLRSRRSRSTAASCSARSSNRAAATRSRSPPRRGRPSPRTSAASPPSRPAAAPAPPISPAPSARPAGRYGRSRRRGRVGSWRDLGPESLLLSIDDPDVLRFYRDRMLGPIEAQEPRLRRRAAALAGDLHRPERPVGAGREAPPLPPPHPPLPDREDRRADRPRPRRVDRPDRVLARPAGPRAGHPRPRPAPPGGAFAVSRSGYGEVRTPDGARSAGDGEGADPCRRARRRRRASDRRGTRRRPSRWRRARPGAERQPGSWARKQPTSRGAPFGADAELDQRARPPGGDVESAPVGCHGDPARPGEELARDRRAARDGGVADAAGEGEATALRHGETGDRADLRGDVDVAAVGRHGDRRWHR